MPILTLTGIKQDNFIDTAISEDLMDHLMLEATIGQSNITVSNGALFKVGEMVIIYDGDGTFETATVQSINGNILTLRTVLLNNYPLGSSIGKFYGVIDTANKKYTRPIAPDLGTGADGNFVSSGNATWSSEKNFQSVIIQNGHTITVSGNFNIKCRGEFRIETGGVLTAKGQGHAGGSYATYYSYQGTSELGSGTNTYTANGGGGGGGQCSGTGQNSGAGGGGGGYGSAGGDGSLLGGSQYGRGGGVYNDAGLTNENISYRRGSGGGGGCSGIQMQAGYGGAGGGVINIQTKTLVVQGQISCDGNDGQNAQAYNTSFRAGGGGGGSGGTIFIVCLLGATIGSNLLHANGGAGGMGDQYGTPTTSGKGGNGGVGRIRIEAGAISGTSTPTYAKGYAGGASGRMKFGWYMSKEILTGQETVMVNCNIKQNVVISIQLSAGANAGQANVTVTNASSFEVGDRVVLKENDKMEIKTINLINGNIITLENNLNYSYTTSAKVNRIDVAGLVSLVNPDDDESFIEMELNEVLDLGGNVFEITFSKAVKSSHENDGGNRLVGVVRLKGRLTGETTDVSVKEVNWIWY